LQQITYWNHYPSQIEISIVDDSSDNNRAYEILKEYKKVAKNKIRLWRVTEDLGFNGHGCRNLMAREAKTDSIFFSDMDIFCPANMAADIRDIQPKEKTMHYFKAFFSFSDKRLNAPGHFNSFCMRRDDYIKAGGYDESFTGIHHGDREFREDMQNQGYKAVNHNNISLICVRGGRKTIIDPSLDKPKYTDEFLRMPPPPDANALRHTVKEKVNFQYERLL